MQLLQLGLASSHNVHCCIFAINTNEDQSSIFFQSILHGGKEKYILKLGVVVFICNPSSWEVYIASLSLRYMKLYLKISRKLNQIAIR